jgi:hypothetical protein
MLYATNGFRIVSGQMPYRDFFEFLPAGTDLLYALLFRIFGVSLCVPNLLMDVLAAAAVGLITLTAGRVLNGFSLALPGIFAVGFGLYGGLDATHHWLSTVMALAGMWVLSRGTETAHIAAAGVLCGFTASFTPTKGASVTLGFIVYLAWRSMQPVASVPRTQAVFSLWRKCVVLAAAAFVSFSAVNLHYLIELGVAEWWRWIVIFPLRFYPTMPSQTLRSPIDDFHSHSGLLKWICVPFLYVGVPLIYLSFLWVIHRRRRKQAGLFCDQLLLICITGIAMFLAVTPSLSIMRASAVCMPATILLAWQLERLTGVLRWTKTAAAVLSLACALYLAIGVQRTPWHYLDLPAGRTAILEKGRYDLYRWMSEHTRPGQAFLGIAPLALPLKLQSPGPIQAPGPWEYFRPEHIARSITAMESHHIPLVVLRSYQAFQGTAGYEPERLRPFEEYVNLHYRQVRTFATGDTAWERIADKPTD